MMKRKKNFIIQATTAAVVSLALGTACKHSSRTGEVTDVGSNRTAFTDAQAVTESVSREVNASYVVELQYKKGTSDLTEESKKRLNNLVQTASSQGRLDEIKVLSWADQEYPSAQQKKLSQAQRDLANRRNENVENYIESMKWNVDVDTYNMAKQPNAFSRWFNTSDARLKKSLVAAGLPTTADSPQHPSKASHSIVMVLLK